MRNTQFGEQRLESFPVLSTVKIGHLGSQDRHPGRRERSGQVNRRLTTELDDDTVGLLEVDDVHDVLKGQRLEIQLVGDGEVGRHRFRIRVHDDGLVPGSLDGLDGVDGSVVELDPLANADRPGTQDENAGALRLFRLVLHFVGRVEVWG